MRTAVLISAIALSASIVQAQQAAPQSPPPEPEPPYVALRVVGSQVRNPGGERLGRIEEVLVNRSTRAVDYAILAPQFPTNESRLVPVPWTMLTYAWDQSRAGGPAGANQVFIANLNPSTLAKAPSIDPSRTTGIDPSLEAAHNYFASSLGGTGSGSGLVSGGASGGPNTVVPSTGVAGTVAPAGGASLQNQGQPFYIPPSGVPGFVFIGTNGTVVPTNTPGTNAPGTNVTGTPRQPITNSAGTLPPQLAPGRPFGPVVEGTNATPRTDPGPNNDLRTDDSDVGQPGGTGSGAVPIRPRQTPQQRPPSAAGPGR